MGLIQIFIGFMIVFSIMLNVLMKKGRVMKDTVIINKLDGSWEISACRLDISKGVPILSTRKLGNMLLEPRHPLRKSKGGNLYVIAQRNAQDVVGVGNCEIDLTKIKADVECPEDATDEQMDELYKKEVLKQLKLNSLDAEYEEMQPLILEPKPPEVEMRIPEFEIDEDGEIRKDVDGRPTIKVLKKLKKLKVAVFAIEPNADQLKRVLANIHKDYDPNQYSQDVGKKVAIALLFSVLLLLVMPFANQIIQQIM